jgi:hypothetical protein
MWKGNPPLKIPMSGGRVRMRTGRGYRIYCVADFRYFPFLTENLRTKIKINKEEVQEGREQVGPIQSINQSINQSIDQSAAMIRSLQLTTLPSIFLVT